MSKRFFFDNEWLDITDTCELDDMTFREVMKAVVNYVNTGEVADMTPKAKPYFHFIRRDIDKETQIFKYK